MNETILLSSSIPSQAATAADTAGKRRLGWDFARGLGSDGGEFISWNTWGKGYVRNKAITIT